MIEYLGYQDNKKKYKNFLFNIYSIMIIANVSIRIEKYPYHDENLPDKMKNLSLGLLLNSEKIDYKI